jgi:pantetheine-phosphate adenylyltransferase
VRRAVCPGSYDPVTWGHIDIFRRAAKLFDRVMVCVTHNTGKNYLFTPEERMEQLRRVTRDIPNLDVDMTEDFIAAYAERNGFDVIVKGLRNSSDFDMEFTMNIYNRRIGPSVETIFIPSDEKYIYLSSSAVRELALFGANLEEYIPHELIGEVKERIKEKRG